MEAVIDPVAPSKLKEELKKEYCLCDTSHGGFQVYLVDNACAPSVLTEIGRLRELAFRSNGGGSGNPVDLEEFDLDPSLGFQQLVLWNPENEAIAGGYRILMGDRCRLGADGQPLMPSAHYFKFSDDFIRDYLPFTSELSRAFITSSFSQSPSARSIFALDGLFEGICMAIAPTRMRYFLGKVTFFPSYPDEALGLISAFFHKHAASDLVEPYNRLKVADVSELASQVLVSDDFKEDFRFLKLAFRQKGYGIPPLVNTYINLSSSFRYFGSTINNELGGIIDMGLLVDISTINTERYRQLLKRN